MGRSLFDVAAKALEFFCAPAWNGPRPARNTLLEVTSWATSGGIASWRGALTVGRGSYRHGETVKIEAEVALPVSHTCRSRAWMGLSIIPTGYSS
jgi:hypothetical protein